MNAKETSAQTPIAIVGIGCLFPKAENMRRFWANIKNGVDAITEVPASHWLPGDYFDKNPKSPDRTYARKGGFLLPVDFDPSEFGLAPNALEATDSAQLLGLLAAKMALADAGYGPGRDFDRSRVSVILGVTGALELVIPLGARLGHPKWRKALAEFGITGQSAEDIISRMQEDYVPWQESSFPGLLGNVVAGRIANRFNLGGTNCVVDAACGSSLASLHMASLELAAGRSSMVITGGVDCFNDIFMYMCFSKTPALSATGEIKPFDASADGTMLGEGLGMIAMKRLADAERDGDRIYAVLKGVGSSSDGKGKAIYAPNSEGQARALRNAYSTTGISPDTIELVEAHGTGTTVGDGVEVDALTEVYRGAKKEGTWCALGSVKSMIGHTKASAGSAGIIKAALSLYNKTLPPTIKVTTPLKQLAGGATPFYLNTELRPWIKKDHPRRAAVSALGFGGSNFHALLEEHSPVKTSPDWDGDVQIAALSGPDTAALKRELSSWKGLGWDELRVKAMRSRAAFKTSDPARLTFVFEYGQDTGKVIDTAVSSLDSGKDKKSWTTADGVFFGSGAPEKLAVLFPGQGAQYAGMQRDLFCRFPSALDTLSIADGEFSAGYKPLSDFLFPRPGFTTADKQKQADDLKDTRIAQPALGAAEFGAYGVLAGFGLSPEAFAGHSYGELPALCAAGVFDIKTLFALSRLRGELMARGEGDRGSMLAVQAPLADIEKAMKEEKLDLVIANKNSPAQFVLSGRTAEIQRASDRFRNRSMKNIPLQVSAAFHSSLVAGAQKEFSAALEKVKFSAAKVPVYANKTAGVYPGSPDKARAVLSSQLASPVEFTAMVEKMYASGLRVFLEVGPGARLTGLAGAILSGRDHTAFAFDPSSGRRSGITDTARALARLASLGFSLDLSSWEAGEAGVRDVLERKISTLAVKLTGANYRSPRAPSAPKKVVRPAAPAPESAGLPAAIPNYAPPAFSSDVLRITQESMAALQKLQEQTAVLHARFLEGQEAAQRSFQALIDQQQYFTGAPVPGGAFSRSLSSSPAMTAPQLPVTVSAPQPAAAPGEDIAQVLLSIVAAQTGYPAGSLNQDMDMESDLGIDSIKRVAILSELQEKLPSAPRITPEQLGSIRTLRQVTAFLTAGAPVPPPETIAETSPKMEEYEITRETLKTADFDASTVREILAPDKKLPIWVTDDGSALAPAVVKCLEEKGCHALKVPIEDKTPVPGDGLAGLIIIAPAVKLGKSSFWAAGSEAFLKKAFRLAQTAGPALRSAAKNSAAGLMTVSRLDGSFGVGGLRSEQDPVFGGLAGLAKTAGHEWPEVSCRALDAASDWQHTASVAQAIADEFFFKGPVEMGLSETGGRLVLLSRSEQVKNGKLPLEKGDVVLITGGARGVTAEGAAALAGAGAPALAILGRSPLPAAEEPWLSQCGSDADIKKALISRNPGMAPKAAGEQCRAIMAAREIRIQLNRFEAAGSRAVYYCADIRDRKVLDGVIARVHKEMGPVRGLVHGAGVLADKLILDKTAEQFASVFDTKVSGLRNILEALDTGKLKVLALYSSSTARFGRTGQCDYAMANEVLNKAARLLARRLGGCRVVSFNWGPWDGGMVNDGLRALFAKEGVGVIGLKAGGKFLVDELASGGAAVEVVVIARPVRERESSAPARPARAEQQSPRAASAAFELSVSAEECPILRSHVINGRSVVPAAVITEWLAHAALHGNPGLVFHGFNGLKIYKGIILGTDPLRLSALAGKAAKKDGLFSVPVELRGPSGELYSGAEMLLAPALPEPALAVPEFALKPYPRPVERAYSEILFHGEEMRFIRSVAGVSDKGIVLEAAAALPPASWLRRPLRDRWLADPAALDAAFQGMILWTFENSGACSLPNSAASYRQYSPSFPAGGVRVVARVTASSEHSATADIDFVDAKGKLVARLEGYESTVDRSLNEAFRRTELILK
ncbi:MAG: hypothetical protein COT18_03795 [Elusimicrobia bacterium CG08_land_8_20_14_0_20_59_10]|nr:MAG: hypothetical protein COT18_03795 [Elusimicrobia bacterium CG08_land_8_20_14_0_20_59_10]